MSHGREIDHEGRRPEIAKRGVEHVGARCRNGRFERGKSKLPIRLTERDEAQCGRHKVRRITLQVEWERQLNLDAMRAASRTETNGKRQWNASRGQG